MAKSPRELLSADMVVRFDPATKTICLFTVSQGKPSSIAIHDLPWNPQEGFVGLIDVGGAVCAHLFSRHPEVFCTEEQWEKIAEDVRIATGRNDSEVEPCEDSHLSFNDARRLIDRLGDDSTPADLEAIDALLKSTADDGDTQSRRYRLETWPKLRDVFVRRISRENK